MGGSVGGHGCVGKVQAERIDPCTVRVRVHVGAVLVLRLWVLPRKPRSCFLRHLPNPPAPPPLQPSLPPLQGLYVEMKFERPSKVQALTLPMILTPPHRDLIAQVGGREAVGREAVGREAVGRMGLVYSTPGDGRVAGGGGASKCV